jgi:predicted nucleic acid-binding protein
VLLLDETETRRVAGLYGLPVTGIIGLLIQAKREGRISSLAEEMDRLREEGNFWIQDALYRRVLEADE